MKLEQHLKKVSIQDGEGSRTRRPVENDFAAQCFIQYSEMRDSLETACVMLQTGKKGDESLQFIFGWECQGIDPYQPDQARENEIFDAIEAGLKDLPEGERVTFHLSSFASDQRRQRELDDLLESDIAPQLKFLLLSEKQRVDELTWRYDRKGRRYPRGLRKPKSLKIYATYTLSTTTVKGHDFWEKTLLRLEGFFHRLTGFAPDVAQQNYEIAFERAYTDGFLNFNQLFSVKMQLDVTPIPVQDLWAEVWGEFNSTPPPPIPQVVQMTQKGFTEAIYSEIHFTTLLLEGGAPKDDRAWVYVNDQYVAPVVFLDKPGGWRDKGSQLAYLWNVLAREQVSDTEIYCQVTKANQRVLKDQMRRVMKQSLLDQTMANQKRNTIDVVASLQQNKSVKAQEDLYEGAVGLYTATVFFVHRPTLSQLDQACKYLQNCFSAPAVIERETEYAHRIWLQKLLLTWEGLLFKPFDRRLLYLSSEAPGLMPLVQTRTVHDKGFELVSEDGGVPIYLNFYDRDQPLNLALFATTRAGKSILVAQLLSMALSYGIPVIIMDFPPNENASTFKDWCQYLGGSYFDITTQCNNLFEIPDLSQFNADDRATRRKEYVDFIQTAVMTLTFGGGTASSTDDKNFQQNTRALLNPVLIEFFKDAEMLERYDLAYAGGLGSKEWQQMPTLRDFATFFRANVGTHLSDETRNDATTQKATAQIERQLSFWIESSIGRAISSPSTFDTSNSLIVFALVGIANSEDAAILSLSIYAAALRRSLSYPRSIFFIDECSILLKWEEFAKLIAQLAANGGKAGIQTWLAGQDPNTLIKSPHGETISQNIAIRLIGRIQRVAIESFTTFFKYPSQLISVNASDKFFPEPSELYSHWLLDEGGRHTFVRFYANRILLASTVNNPIQTRCRGEFLAAHQGNYYEGLAAFADELIDSIRNYRPLRNPSGDSAIEDDAELLEDDPDLNTNVVYLERKIT